jgi:hypothetical protein
MWAPNDKRWLIPGGIFTAAVVGLLLYLNLSNAEEVPRVQFEGDEEGEVVEAHWSDSKPLYVCEAPDWVAGNAKRAVEFVKPLGITYSDVVVLDGPCSGLANTKQCTYETKSGARTVDCVEGGIILTLADSGYNFGTMEEGGHGDETLLSVDYSNGEIEHVTALFPADLEDIKAIVFNDDAAMGESMISEADWPVDAEFLVVTHALIHAEGYDHVVNRLFGPFFSEPTGHIMARNIVKLGESTAGL